MGKLLNNVKLAILFLVMVVNITAAVMPEKKYIDWEDFKVTELDYRMGRVIIVDQSGAGDSTTIQGAINLIPESYETRIKIIIHSGIYNEIVTVPQDKSHISFIGRPGQNGYFPLITSSRKASDKEDNGNEIGSANTATLQVLSNYFVATSITIQNDAIPTGYRDQAVAVRIDGDKAMFYRVTMLGKQDTLLDNIGTHLFYHCYIQGTVDFIWGFATSLYQDCKLHSIRSGSIVAHGRNQEDNTGFVFESCKIEGNGPTLLGRAWGPYSRTIYSFCTMQDIINPLGWDNMGDPAKEHTVFYGEYMNEGPGSSRSGRLPWTHALSDDQAMGFIGWNFINGSDWLRI